MFTKVLDEGENVLFKDEPLVHTDGWEPWTDSLEPDKHCRVELE
jgi:hypothetical protein